MPIHLSAQGEGQYSAKLDYGEYHLRLAAHFPGLFQHNFIQDVWGGMAGYVSVGTETTEQKHDFMVQVSNVEIIVECPEGEDFQKGVVELAQRVQDRVWNQLYFEPQYGKTQILSSVPVGEYKASYRSEDASRIGESDWTLVTAEGKSSIVILLEEFQKVRVGGWSPDSISESFKVYEYDLTNILKSPGDYQLILDYEKGYHGVAAEWATVTANGVEIAGDAHAGWSGARDLANVYRMRLPALTPGAIYILHLSLRSDGGTDTFGSIYLVKNKEN